tara:strand:- start:180 stop:356 length:177 start_codon:yes stop_codon:yes gene_type:complete
LKKKTYKVSKPCRSAEIKLYIEIAWFRKIMSGSPAEPGSELDNGGVVLPIGLSYPARS